MSSEEWLENWRGDWYRAISPGFIAWARRRGNAWDVEYQIAYGPRNQCPGLIAQVCIPDEPFRRLCDATSLADSVGLSIIDTFRRVEPAQCDELEAERRVSEARDAIAAAAIDLRNSGYDGPFMGEQVGPLFDAIAAWERATS